LLVRELARLMPDRHIARLLNGSGKTTGHGNGGTEQSVREWVERGEITLERGIIGVSKMRQVCAGAPWSIKVEDVSACAARNRLPVP
jgi:hypothetical protein